ncbi:MAG: ABC transporter permease [Aggregatilineales bacterium]
MAWPRHGTAPGRGCSAAANLITKASRLWAAHPYVRFISRRLAIVFVQAFGVMLVTFTLTQLVPGDPVAANLGERAINNPAIVKAFKDHYGLNKPVAEQFGLYLVHVLRGDLGESQQTHRTVGQDLAEFIPATLELGLIAMLISLCAGIALGLFAAIRRNSIADQLLRVSSLGGISMPTFWLGLVALYIFSFQFRLFPGTGRLGAGMLPPPHVTGMFTVDALLAGDPATFLDALHHLVLPALVLAAFNTGVLIRFTRSAVLEVMGNDYVIGARAKGLARRTVILRHILRPALTPIVTISGLLFANVMTGTVLVENVFSWPGVGQYAFRSAINLDLQPIMGVSLFVAASFVVVNFIVDLLYGWIDPRVRLA